MASSTEIGDEARCSTPGGRRIPFRKGESAIPLRELLSRRTALTRCLDDGSLELDSHASERALRAAPGSSVHFGGRMLALRDPFRLASQRESDSGRSPVCRKCIRLEIASAPGKSAEMEFFPHCAAPWVKMSRRACSDSYGFRNGGGVGLARADQMPRYAAPARHEGKAVMRHILLSPLPVAPLSLSMSAGFTGVRR